MALGTPSEKLRKKLLQEELKLRKKQPEHWAKTKYRKYAKPFTEEELAKLRELSANKQVVAGRPQKKRAKKKKR